MVNYIMLKLNTPLKERLMSKVHVAGPDDCWLFKTWKKGWGNRSLRVNGKLEVASRVSWRAFIGPIPPKMQVLHKCDVPGCVNPKHLFLGTQSDNAKDCHAKGRAFLMFGESNPRHRLTTDKIFFIKTTYTNGVPAHKIAKMLNVSKSTILTILSGKGWKHVSTEKVLVRSNKGSDNFFAKLSEQTVIEIRHLYAQGCKQASIARQFNLSPASVHLIVKRKQWKHI